MQHATVYSEYKDFNGDPHGLANVGATWTVVGEVTWNGVPFQFYAYAFANQKDTVTDKWNAVAFSPWPTPTIPRSIIDALKTELGDALGSIAGGPNIPVTLTVHSGTTGLPERGKRSLLQKCIAAEPSFSGGSLEVTLPAEHATEVELPDGLELDVLQVVQDVMPGEHTINVRNERGTYRASAEVSQAGVELSLWRKVPGGEEEVMDVDVHLWSEILPDVEPEPMVEAEKYVEDK